jgi:hypothetical protein
MKNGLREPSFGPYQMLIGGGDTGFPEGLGNRAVAAGIDPRNPDHWKRGIEFALNEAKRDGWRQWYGAKAAGIDRWDGINNRAGNTRPMGGVGSDYVAEAQAKQQGPSMPAPEMAGGPDVPAKTGAYAFNEEKKPTIWDRIEGIDQIAKAFQTPAPRITGGGPSAGDNRLLTAALNGPGVAQSLLQKRLGFLLGQGGRA